MLFAAAAPNALARRFASSASSAEAAAGQVTAYPGSMKLFHWTMGAGALGCMGLVKLAQNTDDKKEKISLMRLHKSIGLLMMGAIVPRIGLRLVSKVPLLPPGNFFEHALANISHASMYFFLLFMPMSGVAMGYFGAKGLPFFGTTIPPKQNRTKSDGQLSKNAYKYHKLVGQAFEILTLAHVGAVGAHFAKGQNILKRMI